MLFSLPTTQIIATKTRPTAKKKKGGRKGRKISSTQLQQLARAFVSLRSPCIPNAAERVPIVFHRIHVAKDILECLQMTTATSPQGFGEEFRRFDMKHSRIRIAQGDDLFGSRTRTTQVYERLVFQRCLFALLTVNDECRHAQSQHMDRKYVREKISNKRRLIKCPDRWWCELS